MTTNDDMDVGKGKHSLTVGWGAKLRGNQCGGYIPAQSACYLYVCFQG